jgi:hypothetical protein
MRKNTMICIVLVLILITLIYFFCIRKDMMNVEKKSEEFFKLTLDMNSAKCRTKTMEDQYLLLKKSYDSYINTTNVSNLTGLSEKINKFTEAFNQYESVYSQLKNCSTYCVNGVYEEQTGSCSCPSETPIPVLNNEKVYCLSQDDIKNPEIYGKIDASNTKNKIITDEKNKVQVKNAPSFKVYGKYTKGDKSVYVTSQSGMFSQPIILGDSYTKDFNECIDKCITSSESTAFSFNGNDNKCTLYSNTNVLLSDFEKEGSLIVGTKTSPI